MAWGFDDLVNWAEGIRRTFSGGPSSGPGSVANKNIQQGIVNPLKVGAEVSGVTQGYRGARPNASVKDQGLALLALGGYLSGGVANSLATDPRKYIKGPNVISKTVDTLNDFRPSKNSIYGVHMSPKSGLKNIDIAKGMKDGVASPNWYDNKEGANYFFNMDNASEEKLRQMQTYLDAFGRGKNSSMSAYLVRAPRRGAFTDVNDMYPGEEPIWQKLDYLFDEASATGNIALDGQMYTKNPLKVLKEIELKQGGRRSISSQKLSDAMLKFNSKNPNSNKTNKSVIEKWAKKMFDQEQQDLADHIENFGKYKK